MQRDLFDEEHELFRRELPTLARQGGRPSLPRVGGRADRPARPVPGGRASTASSAWRSPSEYGGGGVDDFRYNLVIGEEIQAAGVDAAGLGITLHNDICLPVLPPLLHRRAAGSAGCPASLGRAHHRDRHDRARHRLRPGVDVDHRDPRRRPLRRERLEDVHHQRHQRRPRHHRGEDRPDPAAQGHVAARPRAGHGGLRAGPQPRQDRAARPGHRRAVLQRRAGAGRQPARRRGRGVPHLVANLPAGAAVDRRRPASPRPAPRSTGRSTT